MRIEVEVETVEVPNELSEPNGHGKVLMPSDAADRQLPEIAKQPPVRLSPTLEVEVALPEMLRPLSVVVPKPVPEMDKNLIASEDEATSKTGLV